MLAMDGIMTAMSRVMLAMDRIMTAMSRIMLVMDEITPVIGLIMLDRFHKYSEKSKGEILCVMKKCC